MKRLCIYVTYDKQNIVDRYVGYMLRELKTCAEHLAVVCNMPRVVRGADVLEEYADEIFYRENIGFDAGGFKDALCNLIGWDQVFQYDELVLANDSFFGPFRPMADIFKEMDKKGGDFWGLNRHEKRRDDHIGVHMPEFVESYFLVVRSPMLHAPVFRDFWDQMPYARTFESVIQSYEMAFTAYFKNHGYTYCTLADSSANDSGNFRNNFSQYALLSFELISKRNYPFLKKQQMSFYTLDRQTQENHRLALCYIEHNTDYDVDLIWENILRTMNIADLQRNLNLQYIVKEKKGFGERRRSLALAVFVRYEKSGEYLQDYLKRLRRDMEIVVFSKEEGLLADYRRYGYECRLFNREEAGKILKKFGSYDFVGIIHDTDMTSDKRPSYIGKSQFYSIGENLIKSGGYVRGILELFEQEPRLGLLASPQPNFADFFGEIGKGWDERFAGSKEALDRLGITVPVSEMKPPFTVFDNFWIRGNILEQIFSISEKDVQYLPYIWCYIAQEAGYYSGIVESSQFASQNEVNLLYYLREICRQVRKSGGEFQNFLELRQVIFRHALESYLKTHDLLYIYGTGEMAHYYKGLISQYATVAAYIVSDGQVKKSEIDGLKVLYLSEVDRREKDGLVVCLDETNQMQVIPLLEEKGWKDYLCI